MAHTGAKLHRRRPHDDEGREVCIHHNSAERDGKLLDVDCCLVFELKDGRVTDGREYFYDLNAWDEFWS